MIFKGILAQVRAPRAKMAEKCENVLITVKVIDMVLIGGPESFQVIVKVMEKNTTKWNMSGPVCLPRANDIFNLMPSLTIK